MPDQLLRTPSPFPWWILLWSLLLPAVYLPHLTARFDFIDDGCLVYPAPCHSTVERLQIVWQKTLADFHERGPFRPVVWAHWEAAADLFGASAFHHRLARLAWAMLSTGILLWLFHELGIGRIAAVLTAALAMWNPYRNEIWLGLGLTEAIAMPYALCALICAVKGSQSSRPWIWDMAGMLSAVAALCCKNTFAAVVPAQMLLRCLGSSLPWHYAWRRHGWPACLLGITLLLPIAHFAVFRYLRLSASPAGYAVELTWMQIWRMPRTVLGAVSIEYMAPAMALAVYATLARRASERLEPDKTDPSLAQIRHRNAVLVGLLLLAGGIAIYLPINGVSGRYSLPAAWGADLCIAVLLNMLARAPSCTAKRAAYAAFGCGLAAVMVSTLGKEEKYAARAELLWQALECVEKRAPANTQLAWVGTFDTSGRSRELAVNEAVHFRWHLSGRGRPDIGIQLLDERGLPRDGANSTWTISSPGLLLTGSDKTPDRGEWALLREFCADYWMGSRDYHCYLWARNPDLVTRLNQSGR